MQFIARASRSFDRKTRVLVSKLRPTIESAIPWWIVTWLVLSAWKVSGALGEGPSGSDVAYTVLPYLLIALAPVVALRLAESAFTDRSTAWTPRTRLARIGRWRDVAVETAREHRLFGPVGFLASLTIGMLLNVVLRSGEFLLAVPAIGTAAPDWARALFLSMAFETMAMNFLYMVCFVMALRAVPAFPRMLVATWIVDLAFQLRTATIVGSHEALPPDVAIALTGVLQGNVQKVCISIFIWLPYLLLSKRVNLTYRHRLAR
ncbi:DUF2569 domain-containing protein [Qipengyuania soli]|uniref:DUF2569 domain-containing protein n=1 Tax=Qipengyuania soli TaxID=2782568 RepID=A0A7S8IV68_9SPHN|nr:DUF2569 domain-containing protein [Qipengyuania soli]QPC98476.1 DUF2569 domain-containing protein [Qipengyuania soli]